MPRKRLVFADLRALKRWLHDTKPGRELIAAAVENACLNCEKLRDAQLAVDAAKARTLVVVGNDWVQVYSEGLAKIILGDMSPEHGLIEEARVRRALPWSYREVFDFCRPKGQDVRRLTPEGEEWRDYLLAALRELSEIRKGTG
jgi:hypothetical protein